MNRTFAKSALAAIASIGLAIPLVLPATSASASAAIASGEVTLGNATIEPAINGATGQPMYLLTPKVAPVTTETITYAPLYIVVYPRSSGVTTPLNCMHVPSDNCPDHGLEVASAASAIAPLIYGSDSVTGAGVLGHDHIGSAPGGVDFNFQWVPVLVLFTNAGDAQHRVTTLTQLQALFADHHRVIVVPLDGTHGAPNAAFNCSVVNAAAYNNGTAVTPGSF